MTDPWVPPDLARSPVSAAGLGQEEAHAAALDRVLKESDYRDRLAREACEILRLERRLRDGVEGNVSRRFCLRVAEEAERLEYGLLDVGARGNRTYAPFAELVTAVRWTAKALHALLHLRGRIQRYLGERGDLLAFRTDLEGLVSTLAGRLDALLQATREEAAGPLGLPVPADASDPAGLRGEESRWRLPQNVLAQESEDERERIADVATSFLALADEICRLPMPPSDDPAALEDWVRTTFQVAAAQEARVRMHAIQSTYDVSVAGTALEAADPDLKRFRGYVSILLHLLEAVAYLLQVHARLSADVRSARVRARVEALVGAGAYLGFAARFGFVNAVACFREARTTTAAVLDRYTRVHEITLDLPPGRKLHLRPAGLIVRVVQHHGLPVQMRMAQESVDAHQLMDVILLAASHASETRVSFRGDERPLADLRLLFAHRLGEEGFDQLPSSLGYLLSFRAT